MKINDDFFMNLAIDEAWKYQFLTYPNPAVGSVVVKNQTEILSIEAHKKAGEAHAEVLALKSAYLKYKPNDVLKTINNPFEIHSYLEKYHNGFFHDCTIYVTLEPCSHEGKTPSCAKLLSKLKPKRVVISKRDNSKTAKGGIKILEKAGIDFSFDCMKHEGYDLIYPFIKWSSGTFIFYKMAQTINGTVDGGYISSNQILAYVHTLRDKIDLLAIGGNSVRVDRPTLDARFIAGKAPNVMIYSQKAIFDKSIPLFRVDNREVFISDDLYRLLDYKFVMFEGTYTLLEKLIDKIDYLVLLVSPTMKNGLNSSKIDINFRVVHENYIGKDKIIFLKKDNS